MQKTVINRDIFTSKAESFNVRKAIFDSDTASDDTVAMFLASRWFHLLGVTVVAGNVDFLQEVRNAVFTVEELGLNTDVYPGSRRPILGKWRTVPEVHGANGMGSLNVVEKGRASEEHAVDAIVRLSKEYPKDVEVLAVSPLTNIALAYLRDPELVDRVNKVWIMGGALWRGNTTPSAEFNFWVDPEAASIVLSAGFDVTVVPWEAAEMCAVVDDELWTEIGGLNTKTSKFFLEVNDALRKFSKAQGNPGSVHPDTLTVMVAAHPEIVKESKRVFISVETCSEARGAMMVDSYGLTGRKANAELVLGV